MSVACCGNKSVAEEQVVMNKILAYEKSVCPVVVCDRFCFVVSVFYAVFSVKREKINVFVESFINPCKVIDTEYVNFNIFSFDFFFFAEHFLGAFSKKLLCSENFMAAAECFDFGENSVKCS